MPFAVRKWVAMSTLMLANCLVAATVSEAQTASPATRSTSSVAGAQLPNLGDGSDMTSSDERRLGERIARELYRDPDYIDDPVLGEYVQGIWQPLLAAARLRGDLSAELDERFAWEILMGRDRSVNAFALPGGYFGLHLGLIAVVSNRDELASVLGHELTHVTQRHISRLISKQNAQSPWLIGALILGALAASKNPEAANALITGGQAVAAQNQLNFSRDMEREADRIGFGVMTQAGFEAQGFVSMFDKLQQASRLNDRGSFPYLRSHPLTTERMADMQSRLRAAQTGALGAAPPVGKLEHALIAARARVLSYSSVDDLHGWAALTSSADFSTQDPARQAASLYGAGLAALKLRNFSAGLKLQAHLAGITRADPPAARLTRLLGAELALASGNARQAVLLLGAAAPGDDGAAATSRRPEALLASQAQLGAGQAPIATERLQTWVAAHPRDAAAWQLLSSAYAAQGQLVRAVRADAESRVALMDYGAALDRFKAAQGLAREMANQGSADHIEASIIDTRARQVALLLKEQAVQR